MPRTHPVVAADGLPPSAISEGPVRAAEDSQPWTPMDGGMGSPRSAATHAEAYLSIGPL